MATMGYSRATFVKFTSSEDTATLCAGLREAFDYFGGVPEHVLFDNAKSVVIERDAYGEGLHRWNDALKELAEACGFKPRLCRPYRAKTKGKVERFNAYLKGSFVVPLAATIEATGLRLEVDVANAHVRRWLAEVANARMHATTNAVPAIRLIESERDQDPSVNADSVDAHLIPAMSTIDIFISRMLTTWIKFNSRRRSSMPPNQNRLLKEIA